MLDFGKVVRKTNDWGLVIQCSGEGRDGYDGAKGQIVLWGHPNFPILAEGDHVEVYGLETAAAEIGGGTRHAYRYTK